MRSLKEQLESTINNVGWNKKELEEAYLYLEEVIKNYAEDE